jgi:xylulokinase
MFHSEIALVNITEGAAFGAALLAGVGAGVYASVEEACARTIRSTDTVAPGKDVRTYDDYYRVYRALYPALKEQFHEVSTIAARYA